MEQKKKYYERMVKNGVFLVLFINIQRHHQHRHLYFLQPPFRRLVAWMCQFF